VELLIGVGLLLLVLLGFGAGLFTATVCDCRWLRKGRSSVNRAIDRWASQPPSQPPPRHAMPRQPGRW